MPKVLTSRTIYTTIWALGLGDFALRILNACIIKLGFPKAKLFLCAMPRSRDQSALLAFTPFVDRYIDPAHVTPNFIELCEWGQHPTLSKEVQEEIRRINLTYNCNMQMRQGHCDDRAIFAVPEEMEGPLENRLLSLGLKRDRWFVCLHVREDGYRGNWAAPGKNVHPRSVHDLGPYVELVRYIVEERGGQVVRLGDPVQTPFPKIPGYIDLAGIPDSFALQMYALSRSRFLYGSDSGPLLLARCFNVPVIGSNMVNLQLSSTYLSLVFGVNHLIGSKIFNHEGRELRDREAFKAGITREEVWCDKLVQLRELPLVELVRMFEILLHRTRDQVPWHKRELAQHSDTWGEFPTADPAPFNAMYLTDYPQGGGREFLKTDSAPMTLAQRVDAQVLNYFLAG